MALYEMALSVVTPRDLGPIADGFGVCPHELSLAYSELCDIIISDINYFFDPAVYLRRYFTEGGNHALLIDEAHNLEGRAREMFSAEISTSALRHAAKNPILGEHSTLSAELTIRSSIRTLITQFRLILRIFLRIILQDFTTAPLI